MSSYPDRMASNAGERTIPLGRDGVRPKRLVWRKTAIFLRAFHRSIFTGTFPRSGAGENWDIDSALVIEVDSLNPPVTLFFISSGRAAW